MTLPIDSALGVGLSPYAGLSTFMRVRPTRDLTGVKAAIVGVPYDASVSYRTGCRFGPRKIREVSAVIWGYHPHFNVTPARDLNLIDYGDADVIPTDAALNLEQIQAPIRAICAAGAVPVTLGGDHSITFPILREIAKKHGPVSVIHFDSHMDTWEGAHGQRYTHATPFRRAIEEGLINTCEYYQIGIRGPEESAADIQGAVDLGAQIIGIDSLMRPGGIEAAIGRVRAGITGPVYVSLDIDVADPAYAPATGTPEIGGLTSYQLLQLIRGLRGLRFTGFDIVEVSPPYDHADITALLAANLAFEFLSLLADSRR
jgi:agmatinase/guanidinopropionase